MLTKTNVESPQFNILYTGDLMPRKKKSRKVGKIGTPKLSTNVRKTKEKRVNKPLGNPAGSRNSEIKIAAGNTGGNINQDPRHGSKKPVDLFAKTTEQNTKPKVKHFSPAKELESLEKDSKLSELLDRVDSGKKLTKEEQHYVDKNLARHKQLCEMLGLNDDLEEEADSVEVDPLSSFESINIDDYKD